jgi:hypothetical protein
LAPYAIQSVGVSNSGVSSDTYMAAGYDIHLDVPAVAGFGFADLSGSPGRGVMQQVQQQLDQCDSGAAYCSFTFTSNRAQFAAESFQGSVGETPAIIWHSPSQLADGSGAGPGPQRWEVIWYSPTADVTYVLALAGTAVQTVGGDLAYTDPANAAVAARVSALAASFRPVHIGPLPQPPAATPTTTPTPVKTAAPAPILEQLPVIFAGGAINKSGVPQQQESDEFSLAGGNYNLAGSVRDGGYNGCSIYTDLWSPEHEIRFGETGGQASELRFGAAPAAVRSTTSSVFTIPNVPPGSHYRLRLKSAGCDQWTLRLTR